jgi:hypothetical protein
LPFKCNLQRYNTAAGVSVRQTAKPHDGSGSGWEAEGPWFTVVGLCTLESS